MSSHTPKVKSSLSHAIRQAANAAGNSKSRLGDFFRRLSFRKGRTVAIIATARKIAVIIYKMLETHQPYCYEYTQEDSERFKQMQIKKTIKNIKKHGIAQSDLVMAF